MKIIKNGKRNCGAFKFKCDKCGCKFKADVSDYEKVTDEIIKCNCPNCDKEITKNIYKKMEFNFPFPAWYYILLAVVNLVLIVFIVCSTPERLEGMSGFQTFVFVSSIVLMMVNAFVYLFRWAND